MGVPRAGDQRAEQRPVVLARVDPEPGDLVLHVCALVQVEDLVTEDSQTHPWTVLRLRKPRRPRQENSLTAACCGRYWVRTSDLLGVNEALYR